MFTHLRRQYSGAFASTMLVLVSIPASASIIIDPFTTTQTLNVGARPPASIAVQGPVSTNSSAANASLALGGQRELYYRPLYGTSAGSLNTNSDNFGAAAFRTGTNGIANALLVYDGSSATTALGASGSVSVASAVSAADASTKVKQFRFGAPDTFGLGGIDLTEDGLNDRIRLGAYADNQGVQLVLRFFVDANNYAEAVLNVPSSVTSHEILFSSFTAVGLSGPGQSLMDAFTGTNAITVQLNGEQSTDATIDFLEATAVPEPMTTGLIGGGLVLLGMMKVRRNRLS